MIRQPGFSPRPRVPASALPSARPGEAVTGGVELAEHLAEAVAVALAPGRGDRNPLDRVHREHGSHQKLLPVDATGRLSPRAKRPASPCFSRQSDNSRVWTGRIGRFGKPAAGSRVTGLSDTLDGLLLETRRGSASPG